MAIKALKEAGFNKENHILTLIHRGADTLGEVRVKDEDGSFVTFTSPLPIANALEVIRKSHNADVINGKNLGRTMPKTDQHAAALARIYLVDHLV
ncbi:hypothetical protein HOU95_gp074 [Streptomyces phage Hiyaa]|uniref:Uncharacterized protein n=1 Tax=Streptomyces phage Hiyaa TaxID=2499072 RepID=A0A3S9U909_9CAUD|nr:hypothetical protein HOU95_gp074 [Streptomyces phage Hiyaa]AZS06733.1 hypothetical protein SEA_HIYAA_94 [Streptomyces phage Hiyaa]